MMSARMLRMKPIAAAVVFTTLVSARAAADDTGPWDVARLAQPPKIEWLEESDQGGYRLKRLCFEHEPYQGKPTRLFAFLALPKGASSPLPGIVLVHGGAGKAFLPWAVQWAGYGYAALAIDLNGRNDRGEHMSDGGPVMGEATLLMAIARSPPRDMWPYLGVAAAIRGVSILNAEPGVDPQRIGMMGTSWGGYTTSIAASLDDRIAFSILVYGCGFYHSDMDLRGTLDRLPEPARNTWMENFDPRRYLGRLKAPVFWLTGATDGFTVDSWTKSHQMTSSSFTVLRLLPRWPHGYEPGWNAAECRVFADGIVRGSAQLLQVGAIRQAGHVVSATYAGKTEPAFADLVYSTDRDGRWQDRSWCSRPARLEKTKAELAAELPAEAAACYFNLTDKRGLVTSSPCLFLLVASSRESP